MNESGINLTGRHTTIAADFESFQEVSCNITAAGSRPFHAVVVSVSNNGQVASQSQQHLYVAYNPICYTCTVTGTLQATCSQKVLSITLTPVCNIHVSQFFTAVKNDNYQGKFFKGFTSKGSQNFFEN